MKLLMSLVILAHSICCPMARAAENLDETYKVQKEDPQTKTGGVFVSSTKKNEVLFKANIWGAVQFPGVHYMPIGTRFLDAISFAGGPVDAANDERILLSSKPAQYKTANIRELSIAKAMTSTDLNPVIQPDDIIVVEEDRARRNAVLWLTVGTFILSAVAVGLVVSQQK